MLDEPGIPRAAITELELPGIPRVFPELRGFLNRALDRLQQQGCRRVAIVALGVFAAFFAHFQTQCRRRGMASRRHWELSLSLDQGESIRHCVHLLLQGPAGERPDGLVIADDNLVPQATAGIKDAGLAPAELAVIAHCNFPWPTPSAVPVTRLGYSAREILETCINLIEQQRRGEVPPSMTRVTAEFERQRGGPTLEPGDQR